MASWFYRLVRYVGMPFRYKISGLENIVPDQPKIFISNHADSLGPISIYISLPVQLHPWVIAEMVDIPRTADYLYKDFIVKSWHMEGKFGRWVAGLLAPLAVKAIQSLQPVSVDRNRGWCREAFIASNELLLAGENLLIFPEDPAAPMKQHPKLRPFLGGFCWLSQMYKSSSRGDLVIQPMAVNPSKRRIIIGNPVILTLTNDYRLSIDAATRNLQATVEELLRLIL